MRKKIALLVCISFLFTVMVGCQGAAKKPAVPERKPNTTTDTSQMTASARRVMASNLSKKAEQVKNVDKATVVVSSIAMANNVPKTNRLNNVTDNRGQDNYYTQKNTRQNYTGLIVMVGLDLNDKAQNNPGMANTAKKNVASKLKASDKRISQVLVTTDPNLIKRINDVAAGIIEGRPIQEFQQDINDITNRVKREKSVLQ